MDNANWKNKCLPHCKQQCFDGYTLTFLAGPLRSGDFLFFPNLLDHTHLMTFNNKVLYSNLALLIQINFYVYCAQETYSAALHLIHRSVTSGQAKINS